MLREVLCDQKTKDKLGEDGLGEVTASLWAEDCQTCGRKLGSKPPALCVDDAGRYATASLHHPRCRPPGWNDGSVIFAAGGANLSWTSLSFVLPAMSGRKADPRPAMLVNPGLEMIFLEPRQGAWHPAYHRQFTSLGLVPPGRKLRLTRPGMAAPLASPDKHAQGLPVVPQPATTQADLPRPIHQRPSRQAAHRRRGILGASPLALGCGS